jgi:hypothetical protein
MEKYEMYEKRREAPPHTEDSQKRFQYPGIDGIKLSFKYNLKVTVMHQ